MLVEAPHRLAAVRLERIEGAGQHQVANLRFGEPIARLGSQPDSAAERFERLDRTFELCLLEHLERLVAHALDIVEAKS